MTTTVPPSFGGATDPQKIAILCPFLKSDRHTSVVCDYRMEEAQGLAQAIGLRSVLAKVIYLERVKPATYFGAGVIDDLAIDLKEADVSLLYVDTSLTPIQQRNLERRLKVKVIDRTGLILEIFGERAKTAEGVLQVELAALSYQKSRLVRSWTHLERQRGGFGFIGGPGESQIELDRRLIGVRIARLKRELAQVVKTRGLHRKSRKKVPYPIVALVGYTNAGKSSLFNRFTGADAFAKDLLFATLDPMMRMVTLPSGRQVILSDTVGFISDLPTSLIAAFRATLEEVIEADIVLHVRDLTSPMREAHGEVVRGILAELGLTFPSPTQHYIEVFNKVDCFSMDDQALFESQREEGSGCFLSARDGQGMEGLIDIIETCLGGQQQRLCLQIPADDGRLIAWLHQNGTVFAKEYGEEMAVFDVSFDEKVYNKMGHMIEPYKIDKKPLGNI